MITFVGNINNSSNSSNSSNNIVGPLIIQRNYKEYSDKF